MAFRADRMRFHREALKRDSGGKKGSQNWLARRIGAHVTSVSDWERGENAPSARYVAAIAAELGVQVDELFAADEDEEAASMPTHHELLEALRPLAELFNAAREKVA